MGKTLAGNRAEVKNAFKPFQQFKPFKPINSLKDAQDFSRLRVSAPAGRGGGLRRGFERFELLERLEQ